MTRIEGKKVHVTAYGKTFVIEEYRIKWLARIVYSSQFELFIAFIILVNAVCLALLTMPDISQDVKSTLSLLDLYCL